MSRRRARTVARGLAALTVLVALVAGIPLLLYRLGGWPVPAHVASWHQIGSALLRRDDGGLFLSAVRDISWLAWAVFTVAVVAETQAALRGRSAPRLRLGGLQASASHLVALTMLLFGGPGTAVFALQQAAPVAAVSFEPGTARAAGTPVAADVAPGPAEALAVSAADSPALAGVAAASALSPSATGPLVPGQPASDLPASDLPASSRPASGQPGPPDQAGPRPVPQVMSMGFYQLVTIKPGDCLWTIAQHYLGHGDLYPEIVRLNLGHDMGDGRVFTDPSVIWPGWVLQLPAGGATGTSPHRPDGTGHAAHPSREHRFRRPHPAAGGGASPPASTPAPAGGQGGTSSGAGPGSGSVTGAQLPSQPGHGSQVPPAAIFAAGLLAGGAAVTLARMRHRQRQSRRPGRRIPMPTGAPVLAAEHRLRAQQEPALAPAPPSALRAALGNLGTGLLACGQQLPDIIGIRLLRSGMEVLLASPASEPPPPPFTVPADRPGTVWLLPLPGEASAGSFRAAETGDLLPGLVTAGLIDGGYLLVDLEYLRVTTLEGPPGLADQVLVTAAAELATSELAGWYDLILVGFQELDGVGSRATSCRDLDEALDLLAAKAVGLQRSLGEQPADIRCHRLADPGNEDWALSLLVSRNPPTSAQLGMLVDLAADPGGVAALVPGRAAMAAGRPGPARIRLADDPERPGRTVADITPLGIRCWPQPLDDADYTALASMFSTAAADGDVAADAPPYDGSRWPPPPAEMVAGTARPVGELAADEEDEDLDAAWAPWDLADAGDGWAAGDLADTGSAGDGWAAGDLADTGSAGDLADTGADGDGWAARDLAAGRETGHVAAPRNAGDPATGWQAWSLAPVRDTTDLAPGAEAEADARLPAFSQPARGRHAADRDRERPSLRIGVLGALTVNGAAASPPPGQAHLLLVLALSGQDGLSNQQLCYLLGADPDHPRSTDSLRQLIAAARRQLGRTADGREWIEHLGAGRYALHPESRFDWRDFEELAAEGMRSGDAERLRGALWLIRGEPLADCYLWSLDPAQLEIMRAQIVDAAQMLSGMELDEGNCAAAAGAARAGLAGDAGAEQLWRALMRAEHAAGNLVGVREAWNQCLDQIAEIVADGEPHPQTAALYRELAESTVQPAG